MRTKMQHNHVIIVLILTFCTFCSWVWGWRLTNFHCCQTPQTGCKYPSTSSGCPASHPTSTKATQTSWQDQNISEKCKAVGSDQNHICELRGGVQWLWGLFGECITGLWLWPIRWNHIQAQIWDPQLLSDRVCGWAHTHCRMLFEEGSENHWAEAL